MTLFEGGPKMVSSALRAVDPETCGVVDELNEDLNIDLDLFEMLSVEPGSKVDLGQVDPGYCSRPELYDKALRAIPSYARKIDQLQCLMYGEKKHSLLIVLQGMDAGGKDGLARRILTSMNPAGCRVVEFKQPTPLDLSHDFLWRVHPHVPAKGEAVIFNRSHYEEVLVVRVHQLAPVSVWSRRYSLINDFEKFLAMENNTSILKFFLHISKEEQLARFQRRLDDPVRRWKITKADYQEREYWDQYTAAFEDMLYKTSTPSAPWFVIPANHKWFRDLAVSQIILRTLESLGMELPELNWTRSGSATNLSRPKPRLVRSNKKKITIPEPGFL